MALPSAIYRFQIKISDIDRDLYTSVDLQIAMHPSETPAYLLTRVIAYALNYERELELTVGLSNPDVPALQLKDLTGIMKLWIEIGNPSAKKLQKAAKNSETVRVYTYKDPDAIEIQNNENVSVFVLSPKFLDSLSLTLERNNPWEFLHNNGELTITVRGTSVTSDITLHR